MVDLADKKPVHQVCSLHKSWQIHDCNKFGKQEHELEKELQDLSSKARFFTKEHERLTKKLSLIQVRGDSPDLIASVQREYLRTLQKMLGTRKKSIVFNNN